MAAMEPALSESNAVGRFVIVPKSVYPKEESAGYVAKIVNIARSGKYPVAVKFHDDTIHFAFDVVKDWTPIS